MFTALKFPTVFSATILPTGMFATLKFPTVLSATIFPTGMFTTLKFPTGLTAAILGAVLATTILPVCPTIAFRLCATTIATGRCAQC
jgi:hypothetical protein